MTEADKILEMIEQVDPDDGKALDEIDLAVTRFLASGHSWLGEIMYPTEKVYSTERFGGMTIVHIKECAKHGYTRSRDALKSIRPTGWEAIVPHMTMWQFVKGERPDLGYLAYDKATKPVGCATEELAELHAIIQAIAYERGQP